MSNASLCDDIGGVAVFVCKCYTSGFGYNEWLIVKNGAGIQGHSSPDELQKGRYGVMCAKSFLYRTWNYPLLACIVNLVTFGTLSVLKIEHFSVTAWSLLQHNPCQVSLGLLICVSTEWNRSWFQGITDAYRDAVGCLSYFTVLSVKLFLFGNSCSELLQELILRYVSRLHSDCLWAVVLGVMLVKQTVFREANWIKTE